MRKRYAILLLLAACASAQWTRTGLMGGEVRSLIAQGPFLLVRSSAGFWRSADRGGAWARLPAPTEAFALAASGSRLFAASGTEKNVDGLWRSDDSGATWKALTPALPDTLADDFRASGTLFAYGPYVLAGGGHRIFRSGDAGATWNAATVADLEPRDVRAFAAIGPDLYACTYDGLLRSADSGATWAFAADLGGDFPQILDLVGTGDVLLAQGTETAYRSTDKGAHWTRLDDLPEAVFNSLLRAGSAFYATREDAVYRSIDAGASWSRLGKTGNPILRLAADGEDLYAETYSGGLFRSRDGGSTWIGIGPPAARVQALCDGPGGLYAGLAEDADLFRTADHGASWGISRPGEANLPSPGFPLGGAEALFADGNRLVARIHPVLSGNGRLKRSVDGGESWITDTSAARYGSLFQAGPRLFADASFDPLGNELGFFRSDDFGATWTRVADALHASALASIGPYLIAATEAGLLRSGDGGAHWIGPAPAGSVSVGAAAGSPAAAPTGAKALAVCGNDVFAATPAGLFRSSDSGAGWASLRPDLRDIQALYAYGPALFLATAASAPPGAPRGILRSTDRGAGWTPVGEGLDSAGITVLAASGSDLYLGTDGEGVWRRPLSELVDGSISIRPGPARRAGRESGAKRAFDPLGRYRRESGAHRPRRSS